MSDHQHYTGCHLHHFPCALERVRELERENRELLIQNAKLHHGSIEPQWMARVRQPAYVGSDILTHEVVLKLHSDGPTHFHANDEPPCR